MQVPTRSRAAALGERIRSARISSGMTVPALADRLGLSVAAVKKIQRGEATTQFLKFGELCRALNTTPNQLLGFGEAGSAANGASYDTVRASADLEAALLALGVGAQMAPLMASEILRIMTTSPLARGPAPHEAASEPEAKTKLMS